MPGFIQLQMELIIFFKNVNLYFYTQASANSLHCDLR